MRWAAVWNIYVKPFRPAIKDKTAPRETLISLLFGCNWDLWRVCWCFKRCDAIRHLLLFRAGPRDSPRTYFLINALFSYKQLTSAECGSCTSMSRLLLGSLKTRLCIPLKKCWIFSAVSNQSKWIIHNFHLRLRVYTIYRISFAIIYSVFQNKVNSLLINPQLCHENVS